MQEQLANCKGEFEIKLEDQRELLTNEFNHKYLYIKNRMYGETEGKTKIKLELAS